MRSCSNSHCLRTVPPRRSFCLPLSIEGTTPSKKRVQRLCKSISEMTRRSQTQQDAETLVEALNRKINGWANYFRLGPVSSAYRAVEQHTCRRLAAKRGSRAIAFSALSRARRNRSAFSIKPVLASLSSKTDRCAHPGA
jgi:hypothetical protein